MSSKAKSISRDSPFKSKKTCEILRIKLLLGNFVAVIYKYNLLRIQHNYFLVYLYVPQAFNFEINYLLVSSCNFSSLHRCCQYRVCGWSNLCQRNHARLSNPLQNRPNLHLLHIQSHNPGMDQGGCARSNLSNANLTACLARCTLTEVWTAEFCSVMEFSTKLLNISTFGQLTTNYSQVKLSTFVLALDCLTFPAEGTLLAFNL